MSVETETDHPTPIEPQGLLSRIACIETATRVSVALAICALVGRGLTLLIDGATPLQHLLFLLVIASAAFVAATMSREKARTGSVWNARMSAMAQRVGVIQMVVGVVTVALALI